MLQFAGKHIFCEKPVDLSVDRAQACAAAVAEAGVACMIGFRRFEILGSKGLLQCGNHWPSELLRMDALGVHTDLPEHFFLQRCREAYRLELQHFFQQLQAGRPFKATVADGVAAQRLADAAAESFIVGQPVEL